MKTTFKYVMLVAVFVAAAAGTQAQKKFGHINSNDLLTLMPERAEAVKSLEDYAKELEAQLGSMSAEWESKLNEYREKESTWSDLIKEDKAKEIEDLQERITEFRNSAQDRLGKREQELMTPIVEKAKSAIKDVANENGYSYIFDSSLGVLLHFPEGDDIMPLVKKKLSIVN